METETPEIPKEILEPYPKDERSIVKMLLSMTSTAMKLVSKGAMVSELGEEDRTAAVRRIRLTSDSPDNGTTRAGRALREDELLIVGLPDNLTPRPLGV